MTNALLIGGGLLAAWSLLRKAQASTYLDYKFKGFGSFIPGLQEMKAVLTLDVINPAPQSFKLNSVFLKLKYKGEPIGRVERTVEQTFPGQKTSSLGVPVTFYTFDFVRVLKDAIQSGQPIKILAEGYVRANNMPDVVVSKEVPLELPSSIKMALKLMGLLR